MDTYFLKSNQEAVISLYNGTFENSDNIITRDRMLDASVVSQGQRVAIDSSQWKDQDSTITQLPFKTGESGTYVVGVSTKARNIELTAEKFNKYLKSDGVLDMLEKRTADSLLNQDVIENYQKHVKAIYQVGEVRTDDWKTVFGYPIEFVPQANPYDKYSGEKLEVQLLLDGKPLSNQLVFADYIQTGHSHNNVHSHSDEHDVNGHSHEHPNDSNKEHQHNDKEHNRGHSHSDGKHNHTLATEGETQHAHEHKHNGKNHSHNHSHDNEEHSHKHDETEVEHSHTNGQQLRTNDNGIVIVDLPEDGLYYLRTIYMTRVSDSDELTHKSKWATLTFEVTHQHNSDTHTHEDHHDHEDDIPTWIFVLGSLIIVGILFLIFRKNNS